MVFTGDLPGELIDSIINHLISDLQAIRTRTLICSMGSVVPASPLSRSATPPYKLHFILAVALLHLPFSCAQPLREWGGV